MATRATEAATVVSLLPRVNAPREMVLLVLKLVYICSHIHWPRCPIKNQILA